MVLKILKYPNQILRKKSEEVEKITPEIENLAKEMILVMEKERGIGIAAPQVGVLKRIIALQTEKGPEVFINPKIIKKSKEAAALEEGCLSFPGLFLKIKRPKTVEIETLNLDGENLRFRAEGLISRVLQHEIDHLDGILFFDKISFWQRRKLKL